jgi:hypothetical protein
MRVAGIKPGDTIIYTSSWFGDELWPADSPNFVNTALERAPSPVYITYVRGENSDIQVKRYQLLPRPSINVMHWLQPATRLSTMMLHAAVTP